MCIQICRDHLNVKKYKIIENRSKSSVAITVSVVGLEPTTTRLKVGYSTTELHARVCLTLPIIDHSPDECKRVRAQFWLSWPILANVILIRNILLEIF
jgi:hypothetical protein